MATPQTGIFSLGDAAHIYLEFASKAGVSAEALVRTVVDFHEPRTTVGGTNLVIGFRPELWRIAAPGGAPPELEGFNEAVPGIEGFTMPATQADVWLWIAGASYDVVWDVARDAIDAFANVAELVRELSGWSYRHSRDLTGFEDGTENPSLLVAPELVSISDGAPGAGGTVLLYQQWRHHADWHALPDAAQEHVIGRTKPDSIELEEDVMPHDAHVARSKVVEGGEELDIFRRNTAYGNVTDYGTVFVGFSADRHRLERMLRRMSGAEDGTRDALTRYSTPLTGAYYFVPSLQALRAFATEEAD